MPEFETNEYGLVPMMITAAIDMYHPGMVAGFEPRIAKRLFENGKARPASADEISGKATGVQAAGHSESQRVADELRATNIVGTVGTKVTAMTPGAVVGDQLAQAEQAGLAPAGAEDESGESFKVMGVDDDVEIPADWQTLHHAKVKAIARQISGEDPADLDAAKATITKAIDSRNDAQ